MTTELGLLNDRMPKTAWLDIAERKSGAIRLPPAEAQPEPKNLRRIKSEVQRRWGVVPLIDMLKEAVLRTGRLDAVTSVSGGGSLSAEVLAERLLIVIYAYGTNTGIKAVASGGHGHTEDELRSVRRRYLTPETAQQIAVEIANATWTLPRLPCQALGHRRTSTSTGRPSAREPSSMVSGRESDRKANNRQAVRPRSDPKVWSMLRRRGTCSGSIVAP
ncbi:Tn3 family transposase [Streptomyces longispororuber]|uniref:Tn3 family transposase n=1 Tax=Streptomyces longispororuber TaxID=68230 RepID=UPI0033E1DF17